MKLKKKEAQSMDTSVLLREGNKKKNTGANMEKKYRAETDKGKVIQRLPHMAINPRYSHPTQRGLFLKIYLLCVCVSS